MYSCVKRGLDVLLSLLSLIFLFPSFILISTIIVLSSKGGAFYVQNRVGKNGRDFKIVKFRSMRIDSQKLLGKDGSYITLEKDDRITKVGAFLRRYSLDELPQIVNVLLGDMSFVGPRPDLREHSDIYTDHQSQKLLVRPGITGLNQCLYRNSIELRHRLSLDVVYVKRISFCLDIWILYQTFKMVLNGSGLR
jgi:undecaprenyl phosphate N,N'-diacetylbacillosamine 1-phosphate transferase